MPDIIFSPDYIEWFSDLKQRISLARQQASLSLNSALIELYWEIGRDIVEKEERAAWGSGLIERLSRDLTHAFPDMKGFSRRNLYAIRQWYLFYSALSAIVPQPVAQLPWGHRGFPTPTLWNFRQFYQGYALRGPAILSSAGRELTTTGKSCSMGSEFKNGFSSQLSWPHYRALMRVTKPDEVVA
jgi:hypothetical protein